MTVNGEYDIKREHLLVVEGQDEKLFFDALLRHIKVSHLQIMAIGGKTQLRGKLRLLKSRPGFDAVRAIGVVRDCDGNRKGAFQSVCSALKAAELSVPGQAMLLTEENPRTTVLIMPSVAMGTDHMLEDLCMEAVASDPAIQCIQQYFECLESSGITHRTNVVAKAKLHAFLASRPEPDLRLGEAARKGYWPWDNPVFDSIKSFLQQLVTV